jgi:hypothetical protein
VILLLFLCGLSAGVLPPAPVIVSAYRSPDRILFESPISLNWDSLLPGNLRQPALAADSERRRYLFQQRSDFGTTEVAFILPLPTQLSQRSYSLLDSLGVSEIHPTDLRGTARIQWGDSAEVKGVQAFGQLQAAPTIGNGGFVLSSEFPVTLVVEASTLSADQLLAPEGGNYNHKGTRFWHIMREYRIRQTAPTADSWIWVQWQADTGMAEAGCTLRFSLFHLGPVPVQVASTDTGCDV